MDQRKIMHIPNSIDVSKYESEITESEKAALMKELDIEPNTMVLGSISNSFIRAAFSDSVISDSYLLTSMLLGICIIFL